MVALLKKIPLGVMEMSAIRERAEQLRDGNFCDYRPVLPLMLASFIFDVLCTPGKYQFFIVRCLNSELYCLYIIYLAFYHFVLFDSCTQQV